MVCVVRVYIKIIKIIKDKDYGTKDYGPRGPLKIIEFTLGCLRSLRYLRYLRDLRDFTDFRDFTVSFTQRCLHTGGLKA